MENFCLAIFSLYMLQTNIYFLLKTLIPNIFITRIIHQTDRIVSSKLLELHMFYLFYFPKVNKLIVTIFQILLSCFQFSFDSFLTGLLISL